MFVGFFVVCLFVCWQNNYTLQIPDQTDIMIIVLKDKPRRHFSFSDSIATIITTRPVKPITPPMMASTVYLGRACCCFSVFPVSKRIFNGRSVKMNAQIYLELLLPIDNKQAHLETTTNCILDCLPVCLNPYEAFLFHAFIIVE